jgi:hypothetical protein
LNDQQIAVATSKKEINNSNTFEINFQLNNRGDNQINGKTQIFLLQYDLVYLSIKFCPENEDIYYDTQFIFCRNSRNNENQNITNMLNNLLNFPDEEVNQWVFPTKSHETSISNTWLEGNYKEGNHKSLTTFCELLQEIFSCYYRNYSIFKQRTNRKVTARTCKNDFHKTKIISRNEFQSIIHNLDSLKQVHQKTAICYMGDYYLPNKIESTQLISSTNIYENQIVLGFLETVLDKTTKILTDYESAYSNEEVLYEKYKNLEDNLGSIPILSVKKFVLKKGERLLEKLIKLHQEFCTLFHAYKDLLKCKSINIQTIPRRTNPFLHQRNYIEIYELISKWFRFGDFSLKKELLILRIKKLDKLYEYYCLFHLLKMLKDHHFKPYFNNSIFLYDYEITAQHPEENDIPNTYVLSDGTYEITLYYQPNIFAVESKNRNSIALFLTYVENSKTEFCTPDFILKIKLSEKETYVILDSKFSIKYVIKTYERQSILNKYLLPIASENTFYPAVCNVCLLQGREDGTNGLKSLFNTKLSNHFHPIPSYCLNVLNGKYYDTSYLWNEIYRCSIEQLMKQ